MTKTVTADLLHRLVSTSHAEGITALGVRVVITRETCVLLLAEDGGDFIDGTRQLPGAVVIPGQTLTDALYPAMAAIGLCVDEVTGYLGHDDDDGDPVVRTFRFALTVIDPDTICRGGRLAHWWVDVDDVRVHGGGRVLHTLAVPSGSVSRIPMARSPTIGEPSSSADGSTLPSSGELMPHDPLRRVETLTRRLEVLSTERELAVARALIAGATWSDIANSLGCSPQAAHRRYRWLHFSERTGEVWHEKPLPL